MSMKDLRARLEARLETVLAEVPPRQRPLLFIGMGLTVLLLVWLLLLAPLGSSRDALQREIAGREQELAWMREAAREVRRYAIAAGGREAAHGGSPLAAIDSSAREYGLGRAMQRVEPAGAEVRVWLEDAIFDDLLRWLGRLDREHGIAAAEVVVEPARDGQARVNARLTLTRNLEAN